MGMDIFVIDPWGDVKPCNALDEKMGGKVTKEFSNFPSKMALSEAILDLKEFRMPVPIKEFCKGIGAVVMNGSDEDGHVYGYTVVDTHKAILELPPMDMVKLYGLTTERALVFTGAHRGRSSMVALKVTNLRPALVILHGAGDVDELALRIANSESIPLATIKTGTVESLVDQLKKKFSEK
jgi:putative transcriptional regulator